METSALMLERNELLKRFGDKAAVVIGDDLYSVRELSPSRRNKRLFPVHSEAVARLNATMTRHITGNAQIYVTMLYKDQPREELIKEFWNGLIQRPEFQTAPDFLKRIEHEQARKLGPTSRYTIEKLYEGFVSHIDNEAKTVNMNRGLYEDAAKWFVRYLVESINETRLKDADLYDRVVSRFYDLDAAKTALPNDKVGGDPYFINVDSEIAGAKANDLYYKESKKVQSQPTKAVYYEMFIRVQSGGNNIIPETITEVSAIPKNEMWKAEKNRVVQGDSRAVQFLLRNISSVITGLIKPYDPNWCGWDATNVRNRRITNFMNEFGGKYLFDSFDATNYDASTDPWNFSLGIHCIYEVLRGIGLEPDRLMREDHCIDHYLHDPTLTPWGAFERNSTPSGHNFTGPNGTFVNQLRNYVHTARTFGFVDASSGKRDFAGFNSMMRSYAQRDIPLFFAVGDDAGSLRRKGTTEKAVMDENNLDGFKYGDVTKVLLSDSNLHFLQRVYTIQPGHSLFGAYPVSRLMEHCLFQETANKYTSTSLVVKAILQNLCNTQENPLQEYAIEFLMRGDPKYRLGTKNGDLMQFVKAEVGDSQPAEYFERGWDPSMQNLSWRAWSETVAPTMDAVVRVSRKLGYIK